MNIRKGTVKIKAIVFDIGGTLMEYRNMPNVWIEFYPEAFEHVRKKLCPSLSESDLARSVEIMRDYNPRVKYREKEYPPEVIFGEAAAHWNCDLQISEIIGAFFDSIRLEAYIYPETVETLKKLRSKGYIISTLTDVATGMPDELHKNFCSELLPYFDLYVSSLSCGFRKPNPKGLQDISEHFGISAEDMVFIGDEISTE